MKTYQEDQKAELDRIRQQAFARGDVVLYAVLCDKLGLGEGRRSELLYRPGKEKLKTDFIDISKDPILRIKCRLSESERACLPDTNIRKYLPNLVPKRGV